MNLNHYGSAFSEGVSHSHPTDLAILIETSFEDPDRAD